MNGQLSVPRCSCSPPTHERSTFCLGQRQGKQRDSPDLSPFTLAMPSDNSPTAALLASLMLFVANCTGGTGERTTEEPGKPSSVEGVAGLKAGTGKGGMGERTQDGGGAWVASRARANVAGRAEGPIRTEVGERKKLGERGKSRTSGRELLAELDIRLASRGLR